MSHALWTVGTDWPHSIESEVYKVATTTQASFFWASIEGPLIHDTLESFLLVVNKIDPYIIVMGVPLSWSI